MYLHFLKHMKESKEEKYHYTSTHPTRAYPSLHHCFFLVFTFIRSYFHWISVVVSFQSCLKFTQQWVILLLVMLCLLPLSPQDLFPLFSPPCMVIIRLSAGRPLSRPLICFNVTADPCNQRCCRVSHQTRDRPGFTTAVPSYQCYTFISLYR